MKAEIALTLEGLPVKTIVDDDTWARLFADGEAVPTKPLGDAETRNHLVSLLRANGDMKARDIVSATGFHRQTVYASLSKLVAEGHVRRVRHGVYGVAK